MSATNYQCNPLVLLCALGCGVNLDVHDGDVVNVTVQAEKDGHEEDLEDGWDEIRSK